MSIHLEFDSERDVIVTRLSGSITVTELVAGYEPIFEHPEYHPDMPAIWDLTSLDLKRISLNDVRQVPRELHKYMAKRGNIKAALVTNRAADFYLLRVYLNILRLTGSNIQFRLFRELDEAYEWLAERTVA